MGRFHWPYSPTRLLRTVATPHIQHFWHAALEKLPRRDDGHRSEDGVALIAAEDYPISQCPDRGMPKSVVVSSRQQEKGSFHASPIDRVSPRARDRRPSLPAPPNPDTIFGCGSALSENMTLERDLGPCPDGGLAVTGGDVTLDLNGRFDHRFRPWQRHSDYGAGRRRRGKRLGHERIRFRVRDRRRRQRRKAHGRMPRTVDDRTRSTRDRSNGTGILGLWLFRLCDDRHGFKEQDFRQ